MASTNNQGNQKGSQKIDTSGPISSLNSMIGGILGLAGAPTFQKGENVIDIIKSDHEKVEQLYKTYKEARTVSSRQEAARDYVKNLVQHSEVEQMLVYPLLKMRGEKENKQQVAHDRSLAEHQEIREMLYDLDQTAIEDPSHPMKFKKVMEAVKEHVKEEENEVLPTIKMLYTEEELQRLGNAFEKHKATAPTHPHPSAPMQGPLAAAAGMAGKGVDMLKDALGKGKTAYE